MGRLLWYWCAVMVNVVLAFWGAHAWGEPAVQGMAPAAQGLGSAAADPMVPGLKPSVPASASVAELEAIIQTASQTIHKGEQDIAQLNHYLRQSVPKMITYLKAQEHSALPAPILSKDDTRAFHIIGGAYAATHRLVALKHHHLRQAMASLTAAQQAYKDLETPPLLKPPSGEDAAPASDNSDTSDPLYFIPPTQGLAVVTYNNERYLSLNKNYGIMYYPSSADIVVAPASGRITFVGPFDAFGTTIILQLNTDSEKSYFIAGVERPTVTEGAMVRQGQPLAFSQSNAKEGVYLEHRAHDQALPPSEWIAPSSLISNNKASYARS